MIDKEAVKNYNNTECVIKYLYGDSEKMTVSLCIIAYNEHQALPALLKDVLSQTYPKELTEIVLADGGSQDDTKQIMTRFADENRSAYMGIQVIDNTRRIQAAGWNTAIKAAEGDVIIRVDAHASIPEDFIEKNMKLISEGEYVCGGARPNNILSPTPYRKMLLLAESSMFGSSIAGYRRQQGGKKYVSSLFHGAYRREVFGKVGGFDESLGRTEDNELHWRIRQNGYRICMSDEIISYQNIRPSLSAMLGQKFGNGKWIGLTAGVCPKCLSVFHFVPFCFAAALVMCLIMLITGLCTGTWILCLPFWLLIGAYSAADLLMTLTAVISAEEKSIYLALLPLIFPLLHIFYGFGTVVGIIELPFWKSSLDGSAKQEIEEVKRCVSEKTKQEVI